MSDLRTAAQQALEALEHHGGNLPWNAFVEVRKDLRAALAQQKDPTDPGHDVDVLREHVRHLERRIRELHALQAEPLNLRDPAVQKRLAAQWGYVPAAQAEPVAWNWMLDGLPYGRACYGDLPDADIAERAATAGRTVRLLYTAPPPPQRKPLTEEEIERIGMKHVTLREVIRAVERAHGIKE